MKTLKPLSFPALENEYLESILLQMINRYDIVQMFYNKQKSDTKKQLVIHLRPKKDADDLRLKKWVKKVKDLYKVDIYCLYTSRLQRQFASGHPFIEWLCQPSSVIYQNEEAGEPLLIKRSWTKYKKKFYDYEERFYNERENQLDLLERLKKEEAVNSVFMAYERLLDYDLDHLEELYSGTRFDLPLNERIANLIEDVPEIQKYFVRKKGNSFYLTELFAKAKKGIAEAEDIYDDDLFDAVAIAEKGLYTLIEDRRIALKKRIKKGRFGQQEVAVAQNEKPKDANFDLAVSTIINAAAVEQVYLFHKTTYGDKKTYYLLLITQDVSNEKLKSLAQSLKSKTGDGFDFVMICHGRYWIQKNLFQYQQFFFPIVQSENLVYSSCDYHPEFHWLKPYEPYHRDLSLQYRAFRQTLKQFSELADATNENNLGLSYLFTLLFISFCRTYIVSKTYYVPNTISSRALWQLCIYADAGLHKYQSLLEQFPGDLFGFLDRHMMLHSRLSGYDTKEVGHMKVIVQELEILLHDLVVEGGLPGEVASAVAS